MITGNSDRLRETHPESYIFEASSSSSSTRLLDGAPALPQGEQTDYSAASSMQEKIPKVQTSPQLRASDGTLLNSFLARLPEPDRDFMLAAKVFRIWFRVFSEIPTVLPSGVIRVEGLVALNGSKGYCTINVDGMYDPKQKMWFDLDIRLETISGLQ